ncbi:MAG: hypothetical protein JXR20_11830 [Balneola sp.]
MNENKFDLLAFFSLLYKWRKFLLIQVIIISVVAVTLALIIPKKYSASATMLSPGSQSLISSILPLNMTRGLSGILGESGLSPNGDQTNTIMAILYSTQLAEKTINEFGLAERFGTTTFEETIKEFTQRYVVEITEETTIKLTVNFETELFHPQENEEEVKNLVYQVCLFMVEELDSIYSNFGTEKARYERIVIERRYEQNKSDIIDLENEFKEFSETTGVIALPEQIQASILAIADLESRIKIEEVQLEIAENTFTPNSMEVQKRESIIKELKKQLNSMVSLSDSSTSISNVFPNYKETPELALKYSRLRRELAVQNLVYEFLTQQYEQLKIQEAKDTPSLQFVDSPRIPQKRSAPTRSIFVILIVLCGGLLSLLYIFSYAFLIPNIKSFAKKITT